MWKWFSAHIFVKRGSIYVKPRSKWSPARSTHIVEYINFHQQSASFLADRTNGRAIATLLRLSSVVCRRL